MKGNTTNLLRNPDAYSGARKRVSKKIKISEWTRLRIVRNAIEKSIKMFSVNYTTNNSGTTGVEKFRLHHISQ